MKLAIVGPPGSGKGTQSPRLAEKLGIVHISTGDILRKAIKDNTRLGIAAKEYLNQGLLVPDEVMINIVKERLSHKDAKKGFLLDGFPRTIPQAKMLDELGPGSENSKMFLDFVISLELTEAECIHRLADRRTCPQCGLTYNPATHPPREEGKCDRDQASLVLRVDDKPETVRERFKVYRKLTEPLLNYYRQTERLLTVDASPSPNVVFENLLGLVKAEIPS